MGSLMFPPYLHEGDRIVILSPSGRIEKSLLKGAVKRLESWGLRPVLSRHADGACGLYAGTVEQRLKDLQEALDDEHTQAILCSRGGYGAVHLLEKLRLDRFKQHPKWLIGFSDITALHNLIQQAGVASLHAPMARHLTMEPADDECTLALKEILFGKAAAQQEAVVYGCEGHKLNRPGKAEGILRGGNLAVFHGLRGTRFDIPAEGTILFVEDVGEKPHAIERMFYNLKIGGVLERLSGLIIGQFTEFEERKQLGKELYPALADLLQEYSYPICFNFPVGHVARNLPLINGSDAILEVNKEGVKLSCCASVAYSSEML